ncbi:MAG: acylneuraminate cytidylyltransferase family protein [Verrucomicrobiota bacterium]
MYRDKQILAVVPARGGSKGIKLKNLREVNGVSLTAMAGEVIAQMDCIDRAVVSTDHELIAEAAVAAGIDAPFFRPESLSRDRVGDFEVLQHALLEMEKLDQRQYDFVVMLQPTSPMRRAEQVEAAIRMCVEGGWDSVWTVSPTDSKSHPLKQLRVTEEGEMSYYDPQGKAIIARQQLSPVYHRNGVAYVVRRNCIMEHGNLTGERSAAYVIDEYMANIDTELDLAICEFLMERQGSA